MLFNYILSVGYISVMNDGMIVNDELGQVWREAVMYVNIIKQYGGLIF
jgi:hypothetical protein